MITDDVTELEVPPPGWRRPGVVRCTAGLFLLAVAAFILFGASVHTGAPDRLDCGAPPARLMFVNSDGSLARQCIAGARHDAVGAAFVTFLGLAMLAPRRRRPAVALPVLPAIPPTPGASADPGPSRVGDHTAFEVLVEYRVSDYAPAIRRAFFVRQRASMLILVACAAVLGFLPNGPAGALEYSGLLTVGLTIILPLFTAAGTVRRTQNVPGSRPIRFRMDRDGITVENENTASQTRWAWPALGRTVETKRALLVEMGRGYLILPKHALLPEELATAKRWLDRRTTPDGLPVG
jgi:hypothetical protein